MQTDPILIIGAGAIGAIVGVHLINAGHVVHFVETNADHVAAVRANGLKLTGAVQQTVSVTIMTPDEVKERYPVVLLAVKARHTLDALPTVAAALTPDGCVVSLQNGLEEYKIAEVVGGSRTIGAYLTFGGFYLEPGVVKHGGNGSFKVGEIDGTVTPRVETLAAMLSALQPVGVTNNIFGYLWAKIALGAVYFGTAVVNADVVDIYARDDARAVLEKLCGEVVAVADAMSVRIETSDGFDPQAFRADADTAAQAASWDAQRHYWAGHDNGRTGVWRDLAIHRRPTEIDYQITPVIDLARRHGIAVPHLERLLYVVKAIEAGQLQLSFDALVAIKGAAVPTGRSLIEDARSSVTR
jgi:2-dehydropantoate 2-reductase